MGQKFSREQNENCWLSILKGQGKKKEEREIKLTEGEEKKNKLSETFLIKHCVKINIKKGRI